MPTQLKTVSSVKVPRGVYTGVAKPIMISDPIYPRKSDVCVGSRFIFHGHLVQLPKHYIVEAIYTMSISDSARQVESYVAHVKFLDDIVVLRCEETREVCRRRFSWLSISAAWRLEY